MPNYVTKSLYKIKHPNHRRSQYVPHQWTLPNYGAKKKLATHLDTAPPIPEEHKLRIQQILGTLLYYAHDVDCTMI